MSGSPLGTPAAPSTNRRIAHGLNASAAVIFITVMLSSLPFSAAHAQPAPQQPQNAAPARKVEPDQCIHARNIEKPTDKIDDLPLLKSSKSRGASLVLPKSYLLTGATVEVGVSEPFTPDRQYYAALVQDQEPIQAQVINKSRIRARGARAGDKFVDDKALKPDQVILELPLADWPSRSWRDLDLYVFRCETKGKAEESYPVDVSTARVTVSSLQLSSLVTWGAVALAYLAAALALKPLVTGGSLSLSTLDPKPIIARADGKASLGKLQVLLFSLIVFGLALHYLLRTGELINISSGILQLMAIAGGSSVLANAIDSKRTALTPENKLWAANQDSAPASTPAWSDLYTSAGEIDVSRYQSLLFSLLVAGSLLAAGVSQLPTFSVPDGLLQILGLSQAIYIGGKLATPSEVAVVNQAVDEARQSEKTFREAVEKNKPTSFGGTFGEAKKIAPAEFSAYEQKVRALPKGAAGTISLPADTAKF